jgi:cadmium resistance protein CadD (predicted permease)
LKEFKKGIYKLWKKKKSNEESNFDASRTSRKVSQAVKKVENIKASSAILKNIYIYIFTSQKKSCNLKKAIVIIKFNI